jgi:hypothetical protein
MSYYAQQLDLAALGPQLKRCGALKGTICRCRQEWSSWQRGDPLAGLPAAELWRSSPDARAAATVDPVARDSER